jgi:hypothetical protein
VPLSLAISFTGVLNVVVIIFDSDKPFETFVPEQRGLEGNITAGV